MASNSNHFHVYSIIHYVLIVEDWMLTERALIMADKQEKKISSRKNV